MVQLGWGIGEIVDGWHIHLVIEGVDGLGWNCG